MGYVNSFNSDVMGMFRKGGFDVQKHKGAIQGAIELMPKPRNFMSFIGKNTGKSFLVKTFHQEVSGSACWKVMRAYQNLVVAPYDHVIIVLNDSILRAFNNDIIYIRKYNLYTEKIRVIGYSELKDVILELAHNEVEY